MIVLRKIVLIALCLGSHKLLALEPEQYSPGDKMLSASVEGNHPIFQLWPGDGAREDDPLKDSKEIFDSRIRQVSKPTIMVMQPDKANGAAVLVFPGGGYRHLAAKKEGSLVGEWLNKQGITAFVVKYRVPKRPGLNAALQDAQRAIRFARNHADDYGIDRSRVGVLGFSAGGHLATLTAHRFKTPAYEALDDIDKLSCRPDFAVLVYPAYLGKDRSVAKEFGTVTDPSIPIYITISAKDHFLEGTEAYVPVLRQAKTVFEYHVYMSGGHGTGLGGFPWIVTCEEWLKSISGTER